LNAVPCSSATGSPRLRLLSAQALFGLLQSNEIGLSALSEREHSWEMIAVQKERAVVQLKGILVYLVPSEYVQMVWVTG